MCLCEFQYDNPVRQGAKSRISVEILLRQGDTDGACSRAYCASDLVSFDLAWAKLIEAMRTDKKARIDPLLLVTAKKMAKGRRTLAGSAMGHLNRK